jgi:hypothetical protein
VLFADPSACQGLRYGGRDVETWTAGVGAATWTDDDVALAQTVAALWAALDAPPEGCTAVRWLSFAHHPAYAVPGATRWSVAANAPDRETLVELYSEHGSSECLDPDAPDCTFAINEGQFYVPEGSAQAALVLGYRLGFAAATDSHDGRPGSISDGPSSVAHWPDLVEGNPGLPATQYSGGGLTGALVAAADLDATALFDAMDARNTVATTGPRPALRVWARGQSGALYLPGSAIPSEDGPFDVYLGAEEMDVHTGATLDRVSRVGADTAVVAAAEGPEFLESWVPAPGEWTYLRLHYRRELGGEDRVWVSPWFAE